MGGKFKPIHPKEVNWHRNKGKICKYPGCEFSARCKGYCMNHYVTQRRKG